MTPYNHINQLVQQVQAGDRQAFRELYNLHAKQMLNAARRIVSNDELAKDVTQDAFVRAFVNIQKLKDGATFSGWLKRIVINRSLESLKKRSFEDIENETLEGFENEEELVWWKSIPFQVIEREILNLPEKCRIILSLFALEGLTHKEIAMHLKISESTSKSQYQYALGKMKSVLIKMKEYEI